MIFRRQALCVGMLAAASLLLESTLIRLLAVTQFYHFAFLVVSLALLGYGTSGTILSVYPGWKRVSLNTFMRFGVIGFVFSVGLAYTVVNFLPFDSYSIAWDRRQILFFFLYYLALTLPFTMSGLVTGAAIAAWKRKSHLVYAANLLGSGLGALLAPLALGMSGVPGAVLFSAILGLVGIIPLIPTQKWVKEKQKILTLVRGLLIASGIAIFIVLTVWNLDSRSPLGITLSPYKGLAQANRIPNVEIIFSRWNSLSRIDVIRNAGMHHLPGLSYGYQGAVPTQLGLSKDADSLQPISLISPDDFQAAGFLPEALGFILQPAAKTLVIEPGGGLGVLQAISGGAVEVTVVTGNPLERFAVEESYPNENIFELPNVQTVLEPSRVFFNSTNERYDVVFLPLTDGYRPVNSGAYSLAEDFIYTVESFESALSLLSPDGLLVTTRWVQTPPSESLRLIATLIEALEKKDFRNPKDILVLYRGIQTMTALVKPSGWTLDDIQAVRAFTQDRKFDLVWVPDILEDETNRFNRLPKPIYFQLVQELILSSDRTVFYEDYSFDIKPPKDNKPFFFHFFKWEQTSEVLSQIGHIWQPFGGSGYLVTIALLIMVVIFGTLLILIPVVGKRGHQFRRLPRSFRWKILIYYTFLGIGFMFVEIPIIQRSILYLGHPITSFTVIVFSVLVYSSLGSALVRRRGLHPMVMLGALVVFSTLISLIQTRLINITLGWSFPMRLVLISITLAPLAISMGMPFPLGLITIEDSKSEVIPWVWAVNGTTSVVASVLAAILVLAFGFTVVNILGGLMYLGAAVLYKQGLKLPQVILDKK
jgi:hypothetical protein